MEEVRTFSGLDLSQDETLMPADRFVVCQNADLQLEGSAATRSGLTRMEFSGTFGRLYQPIRSLIPAPRPERSNFVVGFETGRLSFARNPNPAFEEQEYE